MEKREVFSFRPLWTLFFDITPNSASGNFLKVSCMWSWKHINEIFIHLHYNPLVCPAFRMDLLPICDFVTSCLGSLENIDSLNYIDFSNVNTFIIQKKKHLLISPLISSEGYWGAFEVTVAATNFPKFTWKLKFYHWQKTLSFVFFEMTGSFCSFSGNSVPSIQVWITLDCQSFFLLKVLLRE